MKKKIFCCIFLCVFMLIVFTNCNTALETTEQITITAHEHVWSEWNIVQTATCTKEGAEERKCVCGANEVQEIQAIGHPEVFNYVVESTCTEDGIQYKKCVLCGENVEYEIIPSQGHQLGDWIIDRAAVCEVDGQKHRACNACGKTIISEKISAPGHQLSEWIIDRAATCTLDGVQHKFCIVCGNTTITESICSPGHQAGEWIVDSKATCLEEGFRHQVCIVCNVMLVTEIIPVAHLEVIDPAKEAMCTEAGLSEGKHCSICDAVLQKQETLPPKGHDYENYICVDCGDSQATPYEYFVFSLQENGTYSVKARDVENLPTNVIIPPIYQNIPVTSIDDYGFRGCKNMTYLTVPEGVLNVGAFAFENSLELEDVYLSSSVAHIASSAFYACQIKNFEVDRDNLKYCSMEGNLYNKAKTTLVNYATGKKAAFFAIAEGVKKIDYSAFYSCANLKRITIPSTVMEIGNAAFDYCNNMESFEVNGNNKFFCSINGNLYSKSCTKLIKYAAGQTTPSFDIPVTVTWIADSAFEGCSNLVSISIPDSVRYIDGSAFSGCVKLTNITIPNGVTRIGDFLFNHCESLVSIVIPDSVQYIGIAAFQNCERLENILIPNGVTSIEEYTLGNCDNLNRITIPSSVINIGEYAFGNCKKLKDIIFIGTKAQWIAISKEGRWDLNTPSYTIHCTDGDITK